MPRLVLVKLRRHPPPSSVTSVCVVYPGTDFAEPLGAIWRTQASGRQLYSQERVS
jgi:hypothetical protein